MPLLRARLGRSRDDSRNQERHYSEKNKQCIAICSSRVCHRNLHSRRIDMRDYTTREVSSLCHCQRCQPDLTKLVGFHLEEAWSLGSERTKGYRRKPLKTNCRR